MLGKYEHLILYPIHPNTLDHYRKSVYPSGAKSDPADATLILEFLCKHSERLRPFHPDTEETRTLQLLVEARREAVDDKTRYLNRLTAQLKMFFPQMLDWFSTIDTVVVGRLLQKWPRLELLQAAPAAEVADFLKQHRIPESRITVLQQLIGKAVPGIRDKAVLESSVLIVRRIVGQLEPLRKAITEHDRKIAALSQSHPDYHIFSSLPGAGAVMVPRLMVAFGTQRDRYATSSAMQSYAGIAPVVASSGKQKWVRWACPKFLRQTFHNGLGSLLGNRPGLRAFTTGHANEKSRTTLLYEPWRLNGSAFCSGVGRTAYRMTRLVTPRLSKSTVRPSLGNPLEKCRWFL